MSLNIEVKQIKPVVNEKFEFEDRDKSTLLVSFGILELSKVRATEQKQWFLMVNSRTSLRFSIETLMEGIKTVGNQEKNVFESRNEAKITALFRKCSDYQNPEATIKVAGFSIKSSSSVQLSI